MTHPTYQSYAEYVNNYKGQAMQAKCNLKLNIDGIPVPIIYSRFPGGESCIRIDAAKAHVVDISIMMEFRGNGDLIDLTMLVDALKRHYKYKTIGLYASYLPYARQDRVCNEGESLSVKVITDFINNLGFDRVECDDIHSPVSVALLNNLLHHDQTKCFAGVVQFASPVTTCLVSPDAGAEKKVFDVAKKHGYNNVIRASKVRNVATGKIERTTLIDNIPMPYGLIPERLLIVDDILDGGKTFIELAKVLKDRVEFLDTAAPKIELYVTHGIFSAGLDVFDGLIDKIYVHNLMNESLKDDPRIQLV